jgi:Flp pilus assembly pilin Flp
MNFLNCEDGITAIEYGVFVSFTMILVVGAYAAFSAAFMNAADLLVTAISV